MEMEQIAASNGVVFVAVRESESLAGFIEVSVRNDHVPGASAAPIPYIEGWYVDADCRGKQLGRQLIEAAERWATNRGFAEIASDAVIENEGSIRAHIALGFREVSREVHFIKSIKTVN